MAGTAWSFPVLADDQCSESVGRKRRDAGLAAGCAGRAWQKTQRPL